MDNDGIEYTKALIDINICFKTLHACNSICNVFIYAKLHVKFRTKLLTIANQKLHRKNLAASDKFIKMKKYEKR